VKALDTPWGGIQLFEPAPDLSFARARDEWELRQEIYVLAGIEAYADAPPSKADQPKTRAQRVQSHRSQASDGRRETDHNACKTRLLVHNPGYSRPRCNIARIFRLLDHWSDMAKTAKEKIKRLPPINNPRRLRRNSTSVIGEPAFSFEIFG
jgi:hypothetical protein